MPEENRTLLRKAELAVSDFAAARLGPAIEASPYLQALITPAGGQGKRGADRIQLKRVGDRFL